MNPFKTILKLGQKEVRRESVSREDRIGRETVQYMAARKIDEAALGLRPPMTKDELFTSRNREAGRSVTAAGLEKERERLRSLDFMPRPTILDRVRAVLR